MKGSLPVKKFVSLLLCFGLFSGLLGCGGCGKASAPAKPPLSPKFVKTFERTSHEIQVARWFVTIRNDGGDGSRLVNFWYGSKKTASSRKTLYTQRHTLKAGEETTFEVRWEHGGLGAIVDSLVYGDDWGLEFLP